MKVRSTSSLWKSQQKDFVQRVNLENTEKILNLENENQRLREQIRSMVDKNESQYEIDAYYKRVEDEYREMKDRLREVQRTKEMYEEELRREANKRP